MMFQTKNIIVELKSGGGATIYSKDREEIVDERWAVNQLTKDEVKRLVHYLSLGIKD